MCMLASLNPPTPGRIVIELVALTDTPSTLVEYEAPYIASAYDHPRWPVIISASDGNTIAPATWGLIPHWVKSAQEAATRRNGLVNAKIETLFKLPSFRTAAQTGRCIVPVSGFFEFHKHAGRSYAFYCHIPEKMLLLAGLRATWTNPENRNAEPTFAVVTAPANQLMTLIHNVKKRMPMILTPQEAARWIDSGSSQETLLALGTPHHIDGLRAHSVSKAANSNQRAANYPEIQNPVHYPELGELMSQIGNIQPTLGL